MTQRHPWPSTDGRSIFRGDPQFRANVSPTETLAERDERTRGVRGLITPIKPKRNKGRAK